MDPSRVLRMLKSGPLTANGVAVRLGYPRADGLFMETWRAMEQGGYIQRVTTKDNQGATLCKLTAKGVEAAEHDSALMDVRASSPRPGLPRQRGVTVLVWFCKHCQKRWETSLSNVVCPGAK